jgi:hypothetical protein
MEYLLGSEFPSFLSKPEEFEAREYAHALDEMRDREYYITQKHEGTAVVYVLIDDRFEAYDQFGQIINKITRTEWGIATEYNLEKTLRDYYLGQKIALYGVIPHQDNLIAHGIYFIEEKMFATFSQLWTFCNDIGIDLPILVDKGDKFQYSVEDLEAMASKLKHKGKPTPGLVIRSQWPLRSTILGKDWSLKVTNVNYQK